jgi:hypothetical protein
VPFEFNLRHYAAVAEPLRKFAKEICTQLGIKYVDPKADEDGGHPEEDGEFGGGGGGGFLPNIGEKGGNPFKKAGGVGGGGGGGAGAGEVEGIGAALAKIHTAGLYKLNPVYP